MKSGLLATLGIALLAGPAQDPSLPPSPAPGVRIVADRADESLSEAAAALSGALAATGMRVVGSPAEAGLTVAVVERSIRRAPGGLGRHLSGLGPPVTLLRLEATAGDRQDEIRAQAEGFHQAAWRQVLEQAAIRIADWAASHAGPIEPAPGSSPGPPPPLTDLLARAGRYVVGYQADFAAVIGGETYEQAYTHRRLAYPLPSTTTRRTMRADLAFGWFPDQRAWFGFRDVYEVDGRRVRARDERARRLFFEDRGGNQLKRVLDESARYNLGPVKRNFNVPMMPLLVLEPQNQSRLRFEIAPGLESMEGGPAALVSFREIGDPTFIQHDARNAPVEGRFWIEPATGRVLRSFMRLEHDGVDVRISVWYRSDPRLGLLVPGRMHEVYDNLRRLDQYVECHATYERFQRFETEAKIHGATPGPRPE